MKEKSIVLSSTAFIYDFSSSEDSQYLTLFGKSSDNTPLTFRVLFSLTDESAVDVSLFSSCDQWITACPGSFIHWQAETIVDGVIIDPTFTPTAHRWTPQLSTASLDIETSCFGNKLYCIGVHFQDGDRELSKGFMLARQRIQDDRIDYFDSEQVLLQQFCDWFRSIDPDIIIGWHIHEFDIKFISQRCLENNVDFDLGRHHLKWIDDPEKRKQRPTIPGRVILDGDECIQVLGIPLNGFSLEAVSQQFLGEGKLIRPEADKVYEIERMYRHDPHALGLYNLKDCELVTRIMQKLDIIPTLISVATHLNCPLTFTVHPKKALDIPYARAFLEHRVHPSSVTESILTEPHHFRIKAVPGHHEHIAEIDLTHIIAIAAELTGIDALYIATQGKASVYPPLFSAVVAQKGIPAPILNMSQFYLYNGFETLTQSSSHRFFSTETKLQLKTAGTILFRAIVTTLRDNDFRPILHHNGKLIVTTGDRPLSVERLGKLSDSIHRKMTRPYPSINRFNLSFSDSYDHLYIPATRHWGPNRTPHFFTGRTTIDGTFKIDHIQGTGGKLVQPQLLASTIQGVFQTLFQKQPMLSWIESFIRTLESGEFDSQLVFSKRLKKSPRRYGTNAPPHIIAARISKQFSGKVQYIHSKTGPHPISAPPYIVDHHYYVTTLIKPVLEIIADDYAIDVENLPNSAQPRLF